MALSSGNLRVLVELTPSKASPLPPARSRYLTGDTVAKVKNRPDPESRVRPVANGYRS
jgi:hypothetical protein